MFTKMYSCDTSFWVASRVLAFRAFRHSVQASMDVVDLVNFCIDSLSLK
jgi:hypothetical protein